MGRWEIIKSDGDISLNPGIEPCLTYTVQYHGYDPFNASDTFRRLISQLNWRDFELLLKGYPDYKIRSSSFSLTPDSPDIRRKIEKVIFNDPATIIIWKDGSKTVVKAGEGEVYDPEKGFAMAIAKYALGNKGNYYETFKKWLPKEEEKEEETTTRSFDDIISNVRDDLNSMFSKFMNPPEEEKTNEHD